MRALVYGIVARFDTAEDLSQAAKAIRAAGFSHIEAFTPHPLPDLARQLGYRSRTITLAALGAGLGGAAAQYVALYWMNVIDYPINVGGRPLHSWPAFLPGPLIVSFLWGAVAIMLAFLFLTRLPRLDHPVFDMPEFGRVTGDAFFLCVERSDPHFDPVAIAQVLRSHRARAIEQVPR